MSICWGNSAKISFLQSVNKECQSLLKRAVAKVEMHNLLILYAFLQTAALVQKSSEATRALAAQGDILEKELGEIQKALLSMQVYIFRLNLLTGIGLLLLICFKLENPCIREKIQLCPFSVTSYFSALLISGLELQRAKNFSFGLPIKLRNHKSETEFSEPQGSLFDELS